MSSSLTVLETTRLWGGVKIPFTPPVGVNTTLQITATRPYAIGAGEVAPQLTYQTDLGPETPIPVLGAPFTINIPLGCTWLELKVSYMNQPELNYPSAAMVMTNPISFTVAADVSNQVFSSLGTRTYEVHLKTQRSINGLKASTWYTPSVPEVPDDTIFMRPYRSPVDIGSYRRHFAAFRISPVEAGLSRPLRIWLTDINDRPFSNGLSEGDLGLYPWDSRIAPWPAFSGSANVIGTSDTLGVENFAIFALNDSSGTILGSFVNGNFTDGFVIPAGSKGVGIRRSYLQGTVANALAAAQISKPTATALCDCMVITMEDAHTDTNPTSYKWPGWNQSAFAGEQIRMAKKTRLVFGITP